MKNNFMKIQRNKGMTLVELTVVLAIFMIIASLTIFDYGRFRSTVSLQNLADDIALSIRRAQNYAIGVKSSQSSFATGYGIHFSTLPPEQSLPIEGNNKTFIIFNDLTQNRKYDYEISKMQNCDSSTLSSTNECIDMLTITSPDYIASICPYVDGKCEPIKEGTADITFLRPNPDAFICVPGVSSFGKNSNGAYAGGDAGAQLQDQLSQPSTEGKDTVGIGITPADTGGTKDSCQGSITKLDIVIRNTQSGDSKTISVSNIGQISIQ